MIYIVGHPSGRPKEISLYSTHASDQNNPDGFCEIFSQDEPVCVGGTVGEIGYYCDTEGGSSGSPVLALHGWLDNSASFDRLAPLLPGLRLVALDLPGHGRSEHRAASAAYHFVDWVADVLAARTVMLYDAVPGEPDTALAEAVDCTVAQITEAMDELVEAGGNCLRCVLDPGMAAGTQGRL